MPQLNFAAATLPPHSRLNIAIKSLVKLEPVSHIAKRENVSRNFVYDQKYKAESALNQSFLPTEQDKDVLFYLPVRSLEHGLPNWYSQGKVNTKLAMDANSPNGFVLMVEAASIDKQAHNMDTERMILETIEFDHAIKIAKDYPFSIKKDNK